MGSILGNDYEVIEEGLNGRTVLNISQENHSLNGIEYIRSVISTFIPLDIAVISLGLNDIFIAEEAPLDQISNGVGEIVDIIRYSHSDHNFSNPEIIIMSPPRFNTEIYGIEFFELHVNKLNGLPQIYSKLALEKNCLFFDAAEYVTGSDIDGSHLESANHILLGEKMAAFILNRIR